jgi:hypothetical protein
MMLQELHERCKIACNAAGLHHRIEIDIHGHEVAHASITVFPGHGGHKTIKVTANPAQITKLLVDALTEELHFRGKVALRAAAYLQSGKWPDEDAT